VPKKGKLSDVLTKRDTEIISQWLQNQSKISKRVSPAEQSEATRVSKDLMAALKEATREGEVEDISGREWERVKDLLGNFSASRAKAGDTPSETASFIFSMKEPIFSVLRAEYTDTQAFADAVWEATVLLDKLGLHTMENFQKTREEVIARQQQELMELSTPVVRLWDNVLALPLIGTLDSQRTQIVMQNLLEAIVATRSDFAIIDITGVPVVDTLVAQHLLKTVSAARLMGADCLISGIRPQIAQTIIHLGVDLTNVTTKATLADAFAVALKRNGQSVVRTRTVVAKKEAAEA
jgi:rsbT co-antagonist protein RsbR